MRLVGYRDPHLPICSSISYPRALEGVRGVEKVYLATNVRSKEKQEG